MGFMVLFPQSSFVTLSKEGISFKKMLKDLLIYSKSFKGLTYLNCYHFKAHKNDNSTNFSFYIAFAFLVDETWIYILITALKLGFLLSLETAYYTDI